MNVKSIRRENMHMYTLAKSVSGIHKLTFLLNKSQSQLSHLIGKSPIKKIGDKITAQMEAAFKKAAGWVDQKHYRINGILPIYRMERGQSAILCPQVPLMDWQDVKDWSQGTYADQAKPKLLAVTVSVGALPFTLQIQAESCKHLQV